MSEYRKLNGDKFSFIHASFRHSMIRNLNAWIVHVGMVKRCLNQTETVKYRIMENTGHSINGGPLKADFWAMLQTFYIAVLEVAKSLD